MPRASKNCKHKENTIPAEEMLEKKQLHNFSLLVQFSRNIKTEPQHTTYMIPHIMKGMVQDRKGREVSIKL